MAGGGGGGGEFSISINIYFSLRISAKNENAFVIFNNIPTIWRAGIRTPAQRPLIFTV